MSLVIFLDCNLGAPLQSSHEDPAREALRVKVV
jgi:hypothetical protein